MENLCLLFLGDSLIDFGNWPYRLPQHHVISSGIPGERAEELLSRLPVRTPLIPDAIILMTGTNNLLFGDTDFSITIEQISRELKARFPRSERIITSLLPYNITGIRDIVQAVNSELKDVAQKTGSYYFDLCTPFEKGDRELFDYDGVHLSEVGYKRWTDELLIFLASQLAKEPD